MINIDQIRIVPMITNPGGDDPNEQKHLCIFVMDVPIQCCIRGTVVDDHFDSFGSKRFGS
jgi:hypothetical protein